MIKHKIIRHIATIKENEYETVELNIVKWGNYPAKYDLRRWEDGEPKKGVTMERADLESLFWAIGEELDLLEYSDDSEEEFIDEDGEIVSEQIDYRNFFVYGDYEECEMNGHNYVKILACVPVLTDDGVKDLEIPARYCRDCKAYYITDEVYKYIKKQGRILCQLVSTDDYESIKNDSNFGNLSPESILKLVGYSVNSKDNFSAEHRHTILDYAIREGIITKAGAINHLKWLIDLNRIRTDRRQCISKWQSDINYLRGYKESDKRLFGVAKLIK